MTNHLVSCHDSMSFEEYREQTANLPPNEAYKVKGSRNVTWGSNISKARAGIDLVIPAWNTGLTKETSESVNKIATNEIRNNKIKQAMIGRDTSAWSDRMAATKRTQPCKIAGWNKGLTKENNESMAKMSRTLIPVRKKQWQDPEFAHKMHVAMSHSPSKPEVVLWDEVLLKFYPNEWTYSGTGGFVIDGKIPDFTNVNGKKQLIEVFGDYWHKGENPQDKIDEYKKVGFECLVLWEHEILYELPSVIEKLKEFSKCRDFTRTIHESSEEMDKDKVQSCLKEQLDVI
jgi:very-short-patch-repair endonuclease